VSVNSGEGHIVPCSRAKIWKKLPGERRSFPARKAYIGGFFSQALQCFGDMKRRFGREPVWYVLSAKYGFIQPDQEISDYNVSFSTPSDKQDVVSQSMLLSQWEENGLEQYPVIFVWGGNAYVERVRRVMELGGGRNERFFAPAAGLPIGKALQKLHDFRGTLAGIWRE